MSFRSTFIRLLAVASFVSIVSSSAARACDGEVFIRLWQPGGEETWYDSGEEVEIQSGEEGHIYVHVKGRGDNTYTTSARIGYPGEFGYEGDARVVERSVKMQAQNNEDRGNGRIRFRADQPGLVYIGFQINGVTPPGSLNNVPRDCRVGYVPIRVQGGQNQGGGRGDGGGRGGRGDGGGWDDGGRGGRGDGGGRGGGRNASRAAAESLVTLLYEGILRREDAGQLDSGFLRLAENEGLEGLQKVAISMLRSQEFQGQALRRIQNEQGRMNDADERISALLWAMYASLYGDAEPPERRSDQDFDLLSDCLDANNRACENLARSLISNPLFENANSDDLEALY